MSAKEMFEELGYKRDEFINAKSDFINKKFISYGKGKVHIAIYVYYGGDIGKQCEVYTTWLKDYKEDEIYSIVTKEQFESMEYKIGE